MPASVRTIALWTLTIFFAMIAFLLSVLTANTFLSYVLPRIFAEAPRRDIYEKPSLNTSVIMGKHGATLIVSIWAGIATGQYFLKPRLREGRSGAKVESKDKEGRPFPSLWQKMQWENGKEEGDQRQEGGAEARNPFESHKASYIPSQRSSTPSVDATIQNWTIYDDYFGKSPPFAWNAIDNESDGLPQSVADDVSEWNPELRQRYDPKN